MDQSPILLFIAPVATLIVLLIVFFVYTKRLKTRLKDEYRQQLEDHKLVMQTQMEHLLQQQKEELKAETQLFLSAEKQSLDHQLENSTQQYQAELKAFTLYELDLLKTKIKNIQPSYPKKLEAQQKLAVLIDSLLPKDAGETGDILAPHLTLSNSFENIHRMLKQFILDYAGIIGDQTEELLSTCAVYCAEGLAEKNGDGTLTERGEQLAARLIEDLLLAKKSLKKEFAAAK